MPDELRIAHRPTLRSPVLITAFRGWNDGGQGTSLAGGYLAKTWSAARFAEIEPEGFFDFQVTRPHVSLVDGETRRLDWPDNAFYHSTIPRLGRDAVLMLGIEPNLRWNTFTGLITGLARELGVGPVQRAGQRGRGVGRGDRGVRRRARAACGRDRRRGRPAVWRVACGGVDAVPPRAREGRRTARRAV